VVLVLVISVRLGRGRGNAATPGPPNRELGLVDAPLPHGTLWHGLGPVPRTHRYGSSRPDRATGKRYRKRNKTGAHPDERWDNNYRLEHGLCGTLEDGSDTRRGDGGAHPWVAGNMGLSDIGVEFSGSIALRSGAALEPEWGVRCETEGRLRRMLTSDRWNEKGRGLTIPPLPRSANVVEGGPRGRAQRRRTGGQRRGWKLKQKTETASFRYLWF
jgi:hypothetical protein